MLIVPYGGTLTDVCITAQSGFKVRTQHMDQGVQYGDSLIWNTTGGNCSERPPVCSLPAKAWIQHSRSHAGSNTSLIPLLALPFCVTGHVCSNRSWRVLEHYTPGVLFCSASWLEGERIAERGLHLWDTLESTMQISQSRKTNFSLIQSVLLKQLVYSH